MYFSRVQICSRLIKESENALLTPWHHNNKHYKGPLSKYHPDKQNHIQSTNVGWGVHGIVSRKGYKRGQSPCTGYPLLTHIFTVFAASQTDIIRIPIKEALGNLTNQLPNIKNYKARELICFFSSFLKISIHIRGRF